VLASQVRLLLLLLLLPAPLPPRLLLPQTGSRSSPLALAAASHPRSQLTIAIDERSLGFWALGYGRANATGVLMSGLFSFVCCVCCVVTKGVGSKGVMLFTPKTPGSL
jgi:isochorismate synthase/2-succinyl-5-enolpyruvyl-6-hydroxy-3-cyclohexene-1-carboxylate synthase/2-succinyl-6-hydroxy-2,4-cyclohexadiene-1-carboxylate synthase/O-succinylbenzoate synthase